jgi:hypothetical protein
LRTFTENVLPAGVNAPTGSKENSISEIKTLGPCIREMDSSVCNSTNDLKSILREEPIRIFSTDPLDVPKNYRTENSTTRHKNFDINKTFNDGNRTIGHGGINIMRGKNILHILRSKRFSQPSPTGNMKTVTVVGNSAEKLDMFGGNVKNLLGSPDRGGFRVEQKVPFNS